MPDRLKTRLDALERRLVGPKRIALFGHRAVGKTTLLAMFYREASAGRVPGLRLAAADARTAEYLAEKVARIEAGEAPAGTLAETELALRLYRDPARLDLIVRDYQGEHVGLGAEAPILEFFADCDAVLFCLDPEAAGEPADRHRRQQEVEQLLERYIERSDDATADRPVALILTKYDRVLAAGGPPPDRADALVESLYGMTRHALATHARRSAVFAVSAYGPAAPGDGRPPAAADLHPTGLDGPLGWVAGQLEAVDRERLGWLWELAPDDRPRLARCLAAFGRRYPGAPDLGDFRRRLDALSRRRRRRVAGRAAAAIAAVAVGLAAYDLIGYRDAVAFERAGNPPVATAGRWSDLVARHPTLPYLFPANARDARARLAEWTVRAAAQRVAHGTADPGLADALAPIKDEHPALAARVDEVRDARARQEHDRRWTEITAASAVDDDDPEARIKELRRFLEDYPWSPRRAEVAALADALRDRVAERTVRTHQAAVDALRRAADRPGADLRDLIDQADQFLAKSPDSPLRPDVLALQDDLGRALDRQDFDKARAFDADPANANLFRARLDRYQRYLDGHKSGGRHVGEALEAKERILRGWDDYTYRLAYDHHVAHPDDAPEIARRLRAYLDAHKDGRHKADAEAFLAWWERASKPADYRVTLLRGRVGPRAGKYLAGGGPDLSVVVWVNGVKHGPSPSIPNSRTPIWGYTFPRPVTWKFGDTVTVQLVDSDWSDTPVYTFHSPKGDPLAMRMLSGTIKPAKDGDDPRLTFASDFRIPTLSPPGQTAAPTESIGADTVFDSQGPCRYVGGVWARILVGPRHMIDGFFDWDDEDEPDGNAFKILARGLIKEEIEDLVERHWDKATTSRSSGRPAIRGRTASGHDVFVAFKYSVDRETGFRWIRVITAYEPEREV